MFTGVIHALGDLMTCLRHFRSAICLYNTLAKKIYHITFNRSWRASCCIGDALDTAIHTPRRVSESEKNREEGEDGTRATLSKTARNTEGTLRASSAAFLRNLAHLVLYLS
jgi:hypothetical protein